MEFGGSLQTFRKNVLLPFIGASRGQEINLPWKNDEIYEILITEVKIMF
jgi:hypothetical protein